MHHDGAAHRWWLMGSGQRQVVRVGRDAVGTEHAAPAPHLVLLVVLLVGPGWSLQMAGRGTGEGQQAARPDAGEPPVALWPASVQVDGDVEGSAGPAQGGIQS